MRFLFWFLLLAVAAVVAALAARLSTGYALLVAPPYRIELSLDLSCSSSSSAASPRCT